MQREREREREGEGERERKGNVLSSGSGSDRAGTHSNIPQGWHISFVATIGDVYEPLNGPHDSAA
jgi:hypothetical protein